MKKILISLILYLPITSFSASPLWIGVGTLTHNFLTAQVDEKSGTKKIELAPTVIIGTTLPFFYSRLFFSPGIGYAKFSTKDKTSKSEIILQYHLSQEIFSSFLMQFGFSNYITKISGDGGTVLLNNGSSYTSFYAPSASHTTYTASLDLGGEFIFNKNISARAQFSIMRFLSSDRRRVSHLLTANYFF